jgi:hypothetical protein
MTKQQHPNGNHERKSRAPRKTKKKPIHEKDKQKRDKTKAIDTNAESVSV